MVMEASKKPNRPKARELLSALESAERRFDASGSWSSRWARTLARMLWLRGRFFVYLLSRLGCKVEKITKELSARSFWGAKLVLPASDLYAVSLYCFGMLTGDDVRAMKFIIRNLEEGKVFYDVGANYGFYGLLAKEMVGDSGEVHLFEPIPTLAALLRKNFENGGGRTFVNEVAVAESSGQATFYEAFSSRMSGESTLLSRVAEAQPSRFRRTTMPAITLDEYCKTHSPPALLKIDVEGAEDKVLSAAGQLFKKSRPIVLMETWYPPAENEGHLRAVRWLLQKGYLSYSIKADGGLVPVPDLLTRLARAIRPERPNENFVFLPGNNP